MGLVHVYVNVCLCIQTLRVLFKVNLVTQIIEMPGHLIVVGSLREGALGHKLVCL